MKNLRGWLAGILAGAMVFAPVPLLAQEQKPDAAVTPLAAIGKISEGEKAILFNGFLSTLSRNYLLVSQEDYAKAEEKAFQELDADKCTADQCIRKIQEILQIDRLFVLQIVREEAFTQLSLTLARADDKIVRDDTCTDCTVADLHAKVGGLAAEVFTADLGKEADVKGLVKGLPGSAGRQAGEQEGGGIAWWVWVLGVVGVAAVAAAVGGGGGGDGAGPTGSVSATW